MASLQAGAAEVLATADPLAKAEAAQALQAAWLAGDLTVREPCQELVRPARPARPELVAPRLVARRRITRGTAGRVALLHAIAHIELNAVDLAADLLARFGAPALPRAFFEDWLQVLAEEGKHFSLLSQRLADLDSHYGALPAHDGLWEAAEATADDLLARLAVVPLVLEARGLDVTPMMIAKLEAVEDGASAAVLRIIYEEEIGHVAAGRRWYAWAAEARGLDPWQAWPDLVRRHFKGALKPPFNHEGRANAGLPRGGYEALAERPVDGVAGERG
ncbi:MAG: ferritin-like domain-containing protein [Pseudomonadota bacterium]